MLKIFHFLTNEMTILVTQLCQSLCHFLGTFLPQCLAHLNGSAVICVNVQPVLPKTRLLDNDLSGDSKDDLNCENTNLNEDMLVAVVIKI